MCSETESFSGESEGKVFGKLTNLRAVQLDQDAVHPNLLK